VVFASTNAVYGGQPTIPQREDDPTNPQNPYAASKLFAEELIRQHTTTGRSVGTVLLAVAAGGEREGGATDARTCFGVYDAGRIRGPFR
jgi:UDP-glucose 4-epimerase